MASIGMIVGHERITKMTTVRIKLRYDDTIQSAEAFSAKIEVDKLMLRDQAGNEVGRFSMDKVENWWVEPRP